MDEILKKFDEGKVPYRHVAEEDIDYSDIPKITAERWKNFRPLYVNGRMNFPRPGEAWAAHAAALKAKSEAARAVSGRSATEKSATEKTAPVPVNLDAGLVAGLKREAKKKRTTYETLIRRILEDHLAHVR